MTYIVTRSDNYLEHHGIKGQKWGQRQGPPYPLDYDEHTGAEKKFNLKRELSKYDNSFDPDKKASGRNLHKQLGKAYKNIAKETEARQQDIDKSYKAERKLIRKSDATHAEKKEMRANLEEQYKKRTDWNSKVRDKSRKYVKNKMLEIYGDDAIDKQTKYQKRKVGGRIAAGVITDALITAAGYVTVELIKANN